MAYSLNLAAKHVLEALVLTPHHVLAKGKRKDSRTAKAADVDQDETDEDEGLDESKLIDFQPGNVLGKALAFVTQACLPFDGSCHVVSDRQ